MLYDIIAVSAQTLHIKMNDSGLSRKCDSQLLPLPMSSPQHDDLFIDDASDVEEAGDRYTLLL